MARKTFDELVDEMNTSSQTPAEWSHEAPKDGGKPEETPASEEPTPELEPEPAPSEEPQPAEEPKPEETPAPEATPKDEVMDEIDNTNSIIRKRLEKQAKKFEDEKVKLKAEWEAGFDERVKAAVEEELKKRAQSKEPEKTRADFQYDEEYIKYLNHKDVNEILDAREKAKAEKEAAEAAEAAKKREAEEAEQAVIKQRQTRFLANIDECFEGDERKEFLKRVQYANSKGLGDLLEACPMACDYLLGSEKGPLVLQKIMNDADTFRRVFPVKGISPMEQFYTLKEVERQCIADRSKKADAPSPVAAKPTPRLGKPGMQGGGGTAGNPMADPKARRDYVRNLLYGHK